ncbi:lytic transglycosylase domain-containing protein [Fodinicola feengrottensis]|uniref:aggregation-promoting factor C-terminal-like domain-containing protein n=1 Tax=Fodinicola feengrottensis TaxID=435914 RepID=UPI0013D4F28B
MRTTKGSSQVNRIVVRGSSVVVRSFAVAVLMLGVGAAYFAGSMKQPEQITAVSQQTRPVDDDRADQAGALADAKRAGTTAQVQAQVQAAAAADAKAAAARAAAAKASRSQARTDDGTGAGLSVPPPSVDCIKNYSGNRRIACGMLPQWGFSTGEMTCLSPMWDKESGWSTHATNSAGTAWGIPQAVPKDRLAEAGPGWRDDPATQIKWGLDYIKKRYSTPCKAWAIWQTRGWY